MVITYQEAKKIAVSF
ncbi:hypothetical protein, partial [Neisseria sp. HMSC15G01]